MKNKQKGFTLIELLIVIAIIGILSSIVLVSLNVARERATNESAFAMIRSAAVSLTECLFHEDPVRVSWPGNTSHAVCVTIADSNVAAGGAGLWPDMGTNGWASVTTDPYPSVDRCVPSYVGTTVPTSCGSFVDGSCGSDSISGDFCFIANKPGTTTKIWCTSSGCQKSNF